MEYEILYRPSYSLLKVDLSRGESLAAEPHTNKHNDRAQDNPPPATRRIRRYLSQIKREKRRISRDCSRLTGLYVHNTLYIK